MSRLGPGAFAGVLVARSLGTGQDVQHMVRRALAFVLLASALKLLNVSNFNTGITPALVLVFAPLAWMLVRRRHGFPAFVRRR